MSTLKIAFILDPIEKIKASKDSTVAMMRAAERQGHEVYAIDAATLSWQRPQAKEPAVSADAVRLKLSDDDHDWYQAAASELLPLKHFDAVLMRKDPPFDFEYITATWLLERAEAEGVRVFNKPRAIRDHSEKVSITEFNEFTPTTLISAEVHRINAFIDEHHDVILKPLDGMGGSSIFRVQDRDPNRNVIIETLTNFGARSIMAQGHLPEISQGDKRILLIAGRVVPYALARIPKVGETRGNLAAGGTGVARELSASDRKIAETLAPILWQRGLLIVGIDVIGDRLTEINVTSPTCMVEIHQQTGFDTAGLTVTALEHACGL